MEHTLSLPLLLGMLMLAFVQRAVRGQPCGPGDDRRRYQERMRHNHGEDRRGGRTRLRPRPSGASPPIG